MLKPQLAHKLHSATGLSLLEVLVAIAVATIAMTALVVITNTATRGVDTARTRTTADQFVREGTEQMRAYRDRVGFSTMTASLTNNTDRYFTLDASGTPQLRTVTGSFTHICDVATSAASGTTYQIPGNPDYYRVVTQRLENTGTNDRITVTICYNVRNGRYETDSAQTMLTNWK